MYTVRSNTCILKNGPYLRESSMKPCTGASASIWVRLPMMGFTGGWGTFGWLDMGLTLNVQVQVDGATGSL